MTEKNGWHHDVVTTYAASNGASGIWDVNWRTQRRRCCGRTLTIADAQRPPVWVDRSDGAIAGDVAQCPVCGALYTAHFAATERAGSLDPAERR
jgi:hypothetical protein